MPSKTYVNYIRKTVVYDEEIDERLRFVANKKGIKVSPLIRQFIKQGLSEHLPDAETLDLSPTASFYDSVAFTIAVLVQQGLNLPKEKQDVILHFQYSRTCFLNTFPLRVLNVFCCRYDSLPL